MRLARRTFLAALLAGAAHPRPGAAQTPDSATLTAAARALFPHDAVPDATYAAIVARTIAADPTLLAAAAALAGPPAGLDARIAANFALPGVQTLRIATLIGLYSDLAVVRRFGYPGPSLDFGGYLHHGFDDLAWLPTPGKAFLP